MITLLLLLSERTPLERCCVDNMLPFISSSGLSPGSRKAKVQRAEVCLNCTDASVARSSYWSLKVGRYLLDSRCKGLMVTGDPREMNCEQYGRRATDIY